MGAFGQQFSNGKQKQSYLACPIFLSWWHALNYGGCGTEHLSIASHRGQVFVVGTCQEDEGVAREHGARTTSSCDIFNLETQEWKKGPSLNQERWFHGLVWVKLSNRWLYFLESVPKTNSIWPHLSSRFKLTVSSPFSLRAFAVCQNLIIMAKFSQMTI